MIGTRRLSAPVGGRHILAVSVLALLALACLPVWAQADSSGIQYNPSVPSATHKSEIPSQNGGVPAHSSDTPGGKKSGSDGSTAPDSSEADSSQESESSKEGTALAKNDDGGGNGGNGQGNSDKSSGHEQGSAANPLGSQAAEQDSDSSPLVPILIAVAVLAAISIGVVVMRQRRRRGGPDAQVSPEAG